jgi:hypothetical protein
MKNMKLITETWNRFVNEEVGGQVTAPSAWVVTKGPVPGLMAGQESGVVLVVWKVEGDIAYYSLYKPDAPIIRDPKDQKRVWPSAFSALRDGLQVEDLLQASAGFRGQAMNLPVDQLVQVAKPF